MWPLQKRAFESLEGQTQNNSAGALFLYTHLCNGAYIISTQPLSEACMTSPLQNKYYWWEDVQSQVGIIFRSFEAEYSSV